MMRQTETLMPTIWGNFRLLAYADSADDPMPHLALLSDEFDSSGPVLIRIHSECLTGDVFGSRRCDCGQQLSRSMELAAAHGGAVIYLRQEGRGIGLLNKLKAYQLQDHGLNTADANTHLGFEVDARSYEAAIFILLDLGISQIHLLTNNPLKVKAFENAPIHVVSRVPLIIEPHADNQFYLQTKKNVLGHWLK